MNKQRRENALAQIKLQKEWRSIAALRKAKTRTSKQIVPTLIYSKRTH